MSKTIKLNKGLSKQSFSFQEKTESKSGLEDFEDEILRSFQNSNTAVHIIEKIQDVGLPRKNESIRMITKKSFNALELIKYILKSEKIIETIICVYAIDYDSAVILDNWAKAEKLGNVTFLISNLKNSAYRKKDAAIREKFIKNNKIKLVFCGSHAKIICLRTKENYYVIETSANIAPNSRIEQYLFENNETVFEFHKKWINEIEKIARSKELAIYDFDGQKIAGENNFKEYDK